jgi:DNA-directed RNA polymerase alpha subunit
VSAFGFLAAPARRALANAGIDDFADLARISEAELLALHGMGPNAVRKLKAEMTLRGGRFAGS